MSHEHLEMENEELTGKKSNVPDPTEEKTGAETKKTEPEQQAPTDRSEVSIVYQGGKVVMKGPANPVLLMKIFGMALVTAADEFLDIARKRQAMQMFEPGPEVPFTKEAEKVIAAVKKG